MACALPESLRTEVYAAYDKSSYGRFMMCVARVQEDSMPVEEVCAEVFNILGYDGGTRCDNGNMRGRPCHNANMHRDHTSKCRRPDLYRMFVDWSTAAPAVVKEEKIDVALSCMPGPLPEGLRMAVYESYPALYGRFMVHVVALQEGTMPLKQVDDDVFQILGYDGGFHQKYGKYVARDASCKSHRPDLYRMFVEWSTGTPPVAVGEKKKVPISSMLGPLPQELNVGVYKAYGHDGYGQFMRRVVALEEGTMSLEKADNDVFDILGYDNGKIGNSRPFRDASSKSHRPDLYRMFVEWSTGTPPMAAIGCSR